ncbi:uncharacterized protein YbbK (DUF523 family) [Salsuginibacillus halophilus]|uniref:Uncharacterized protein YbbK (DUF523 family) n=1 Tax=Salsuginibacillus halophilus TaxID=517424 RepID=A0A2P8HWN7_9BACI|nr:DUF523 and DUF1722 domain-containing protein [Salsuginibacillus halophilus]PSL50594.1 uncharacterized protein YbbK (DUF523 family) [Salsuginibacillus halophilus]
MVKSFVRPVIIVSQCLSFARVRYNGEVIPNQFIEQLSSYVNFVPVCPEVAAGLGAPRDPVRLVQKKGETAPSLLQPATGVDATEAVKNFSWNFDVPSDPDGIILKGKSPTCGLTDAKVYAGSEQGAMVNERGEGLFTKEIRHRFPEAVVEDDGRLRNFELREHFLKQIFTNADLKERMSTFQGEHVKQAIDQHWYLLNSCNPDLATELQKTYKNIQGLLDINRLNDIQQMLQACLSHKPTKSTFIHVFERMAHTVQQHLSQPEKQHFYDTLSRYENNKLPRYTLMEVIRMWAVRFQQHDLLKQSFFQPYPESLVELNDSGKGRAL